MFKINVSDKTGKTYKVETEAISLVGKKLHDKIKGEDFSPDLEGYELEITGASDKSGFTSMKEVEGSGVKRLLLSYEKGMKKNTRKEGKKKLGRIKPSGLRLRKTVRGNTISEDTRQINLKVLKDGSKKLEEIFGKKEEEKKE